MLMIFLYLSILIAIFSAFFPLFFTCGTLISRFFGAHFAVFSRIFRECFALTWRLLRRYWEPSPAIFTLMGKAKTETRAREIGH